MGNAFSMGFLTTLEFLMIVLGGAAAVLLCIVVACLAAAVLEWWFDLVTGSLAKRWRKKGKQPKGRIGKVILRSVPDDGGV